MRKQSYIEFSDMRVFWDKKSDTIRITSGDPDLASKGWSLTLNRASKDEQVLREALIESGIIPPADTNPQLRPPRAHIIGEPGYGQSPEINVVYGRQGGTLMNGRVDDAQVEQKDQETTTQGWVGPYLGATTGSAEPVFFSGNQAQPLAKTMYKIGHTTRTTNTPVSYDLHGDIRDNFAPGCLIAGAAGSGKSAAAAQLVYQLVTEADAQVIYLNPGNDKPGLGHLSGTTMFNLADYPGLLNPYLIAANATERRELLHRLIMGLIGNQGFLRTTVHTHLAETIEYIDARGDASLEGLITELTREGAEYADAFDALRFIRALPFANLIFGKPAGRRLMLGARLNMITGLGLQLPSTSLPVQSYGNADRLGLQVMYLLMYHLRQLLAGEPQQVRKALVIDPADALTATVEGQQLLRDMLRNGRALNTAVVLVQNTPDGYGTAGLASMLGGKLLFRTQQPEDITRGLRLYGLVDNNFNRKMIRNLRDGECLFQHGGMREAVTVQIELAPRLLRWLQAD